MSFPPGTEMVQFPGYSRTTLFYSDSADRLSSAGLPHSVVHGSQDMCSSPWLFAACHDLLRRVAPIRHPPYAPIRLTILCFTLSRFAFLFAFKHHSILHTSNPPRGGSTSTGIKQRLLPFPRNVKDLRERSTRPLEAASWR